MSIWTCGPEDGDRLGRTRENSDPGKIPIPEGISIAQIAIGWKHGHFFTDTNQFYSWGTGDSWRLGTGEQTNLPHPTQIKTFPEGTKFKQVCCGDKFSAVTTQLGEIYAWGAGYAHAPTKLDIPMAAEYIACGQIWLLAALSNGTVMQFYRHIAPTLQTFGKDHIISVACGQNHRLALAENGHVYSWGSGAATGQGVIGTPAIIPELENVVIQSIFAYHNSSYFIDNDNHIWCCGTNASNCLGLGHSEEVQVPTRMSFDFNNEQIVQIACGDDFTLFLSAQGNVWASGNGGDFRNATGSIETRPLPTLAIKLQGKFITQIAAGCFNTAVLENGSPPFNRMARFRGLFSDFAIPVFPFRTTLSNMTSIEIIPSDELLRPLGFMTRDIIELSKDRKAMVIGLAHGQPTVICQGANEIMLIEPDIAKYPIVSRPGVQLFSCMDDNGDIIAVDPSDKETLRLGGFLFGDEIDDGSVVVGSRCNVLWTMKDNIISRRDYTKLKIKKREGQTIIQKQITDGEILVLNSLMEQKIVVLHDEFGIGFLFGTVGKSYCYQFLYNDECVMINKHLITVRLGNEEKKVSYITDDKQKVEVNIGASSLSFIPLDRVLYKNQYATVVGECEGKVAIRTDINHVHYGVITLVDEKELQLRARIFEKGRAVFKYLGNYISLNVCAKKASKFFPNDRVQVSGRRGYIAGKLKGTLYVLFDGDEEVEVLDSKKPSLLIRRSIEVAGTETYKKKETDKGSEVYTENNIDVSLKNSAMSLMKPGDVRIHNDKKYTFLGMDKNNKLAFKNDEEDEYQIFTPSQLDIEFIEVDI